MTLPLTPPECDLTDFPFMPLEVSRLRRSKAWLICKRNPALAFYMLNLWTACWHERPAGSLENDDDVLADFAMCAPDKWAKVKADALRGWVLCDDGRYYHPIVCEKVMEAWNAKLDQRWRTECGRIKKHNDRHGTKVLRPSFEDWVAAGCPQGQRLPVPGDEDGTGGGQGGEIDSKGEGEGQRQGQSSSEANASAAGAAAGHVDKSEKTPEELAKASVWRAAVSVLQEGGCKSEDQCRSFMGKLVIDYTFPVVKDAVAAAVTAQPADAREYLKATCQRMAGERAATPSAVTVPSNAADLTGQYLEEQFRPLSEEEKAASEAARVTAMAKLRRPVAVGNELRETRKEATDGSE